MLPDRVMRGKEGSELQARHGVLSGFDFLFVEAVRLRARRRERNRAVSRAAECRHACLESSPSPRLLHPARACLYRGVAPSPLLLAFIMIISGYGQGLVMAPFSGAGLRTVRSVAAGAASGLYGTTAQFGNAAGVAAIGAVFFAVEALQSARAGFPV
ncbi:hypothetical protein FJN17_34725 [Bradyrhizobium symbiodeficiens]|uniref:MFS transporter n=1 Tax=Bradyrhizobium symbiodeficiens TaxID=1404367 RepID=A0ABZ2F223_9BRAD|nr:hypothetical protein [Bradyrhizobium symbiodeficiens]